MICNRFRLTSTLRAKLLGKAQNTAAEFDEALFLLKLRLHELTLLLPLKVKAIALVRKRMASQGVTQRLELELAEQREQLKDLSQLFQDWLKVSSFITQNQPSLDSLSEPHKAMLQKLGVSFERSSSASHANS
jgi:hypothetical protein